jgi:Flp pilus assembly pilin Flp
MKFRQAVLVIRRAERGQTMTEYALILATIAAVMVSLYTNAGTIISTLVNQVGPLLTVH